MKHRHGTIEEWEIIAKQTLANPKASSSNVVPCHECGYGEREEE